MSIRMLIADSHEVIRFGLREFVRGSEIEIVAEAADSAQAVQLAVETTPNVALVDVELRLEDGLSVLPRLKSACPELPVLMLSAHGSPAFVSRFVPMGAAGCLLRGASRDSILAAIREAAAGRTLWTREALRRGSLPLVPGASVDVEIPLTQRECEVLARLAEGMTNKQIAQTLGISYETIKEHVQHILRKIGLADRTQVAVWAVRNGRV